MYNFRIPPFYALYQNFFIHFSLSSVVVFAIYSVSLIHILRRDSSSQITAPILASFICDRQGKSMFPFVTQSTKLTENWVRSTELLAAPSPRSPLASSFPWKMKWERIKFRTLFKDKINCSLNSVLKLNWPSSLIQTDKMSLTPILFHPKTYQHLETRSTMICNDQKQDIEFDSTKWYTRNSQISKAQWRLAIWTVEHSFTKQNITFHMFPLHRNFQMKIAYQRQESLNSQMTLHAPQNICFHFQDIALVACQGKAVYETLREYT